MESVDETPEETVEAVEEAPEEGVTLEGDESPEQATEATSPEVEQVELDQDYALARSAILLDVAGDIAIDRRDPEEILRVGKAWIELAKLLGNSPEGDEYEEDDVQPSSGIGFVGKAKDD
jgi:hypothetical protein